jgi:tRNA threonylcarbamoyladenosine modification (KEOPS) complex  Pcc1 subunit
LKSRIVVRLDFPSEERLKIVLDALKPETRTTLSPRSRVKVEGMGSSLILNFEATDTSALRAALNSYLRWVCLVKDMCSALDTLHEE